MTPKAKESDGSQPSATPATPPGVMAGTRSLDRLVRRPNEGWQPKEAKEHEKAGDGLARARRSAYVTESPLSPSFALFGKTKLEAPRIAARLQRMHGLDGSLRLPVQISVGEHHN